MLIYIGRGNRGASESVGVAAVGLGGIRGGVGVAAASNSIAGGRKCVLFATLVID